VFVTPNRAPVRVVRVNNTTKLEDYKPPVSAWAPYVFFDDKVKLASARVSYELAPTIASRMDIVLRVEPPLASHPIYLVVDPQTFRVTQVAIPDKDAKGLTPSFESWHFASEKLSTSVPTGTLEIPE